MAEVDGKKGKGLELSATRHIACTSPGLLAVKERVRMLLSLDYRSSSSKEGGYYLGFNDPKNTVFSERLPIATKNWQALSKAIQVPEGATSASLVLYAYESDGKTANKVAYDNVSLIELPDLTDRYYLVSDPQLNLKTPQKIDFTLLSPTMKTVTVTEASTPFYMNMSEAFHPQWQLQLNDSRVNGMLAGWWPFVSPTKVEESKHYKLDDFLNGWYVEPEKLCADGSAACTRNSDGSYNMSMVVEFFPQRWFYLGLLVSGTTLFGCLGYLVWAWYKKPRLSVWDEMMVAPAGAGDGALSVKSILGDQHLAAQSPLEMWSERGYARENANLAQQTVLTRTRESVRLAVRKLKR